MTTIDLRRIVAHGGSQNWAFEELCCQLARHDVPGEGARYARFRGEGGDGGVECLWTLSSGEVWAWQAKYVFQVDAVGRQAESSFTTAMAVHPRLRRYVICLPFDPTARTRRRGRSQQEKFDALRDRWERLARAQGRRVEVEFWFASEIGSRLIACDPAGGRRRYWFEGRFFTQSWFETQVQEAVRRAGPRYTRELHLDVGLTEVFDALGLTAAWVGRIAVLWQRLGEAEQEWRKGLDGRSALEPAFPEALVETGERVSTALVKLLRTLPPPDGLAQAPSLLGAVSEPLREASQVARDCLNSLRAGIEGSFGEGAVEHADFRQRYTELTATFPLAHVDRCQKLHELLRDLSLELAWETTNAAIEGILLLTGEAGAGKTHAICDAALARTSDDLPTLLLFGDDFREGPVWEQIRQRLHLPSGWDRDAILDALEAAAQGSGRPLVVFIDALNETRPRGTWHRELPALLASFEERPLLRLCISCRQDFVDQTVPDWMEWPNIEHDGFYGVEFDASRTFFEHYELQPPIGPLLDREFSNPLFLKLVCEALQKSGMERLPRGWRGFGTVLTAGITELERGLRRTHGVLPQGFVVRALKRLAVALLRQERGSLATTDAEALLNEEVPLSSRTSVSLLQILVDEELLLQHPAPGEYDPFDPPPDEVGFAYERCLDYLLAAAAVDHLGRDPDAAQLSELVGHRHYRGWYTEALALLVAERFHRELPDLVPDDLLRRDTVWIWLGTLPWRAPESLGDRAEALLREALGHPFLRRFALQALLHLAVRPGGRLDACWLHSWMAAIPMPDRDAFWCPFLHEDLQLRHHRDHTPVTTRLIETALDAEVESVELDIRDGWCVALCWCLAAADRRVRDSATKALVRLTEGQPSLWSTLLPLFLRIDDDYVVERCLAAAYGCLLRNPEPSVLSEVASLVHQEIFADRGWAHAHSLIRDHARCIGELAARHAALPRGLTLSDFQPPWRSDWPLSVPTEGALERYTSDEGRQVHPRLYESCCDERMGDFAIYLIPSVLGGYEHGLTYAEGRRWVFQRVLDLGYTPQCFARYDWAMLQEFGGGRGRPRWADRIGKKYQLIALAQLEARVHDNVRRTDLEKRDPAWRREPARGRDIDPSLLVEQAPKPTPTAWWQPVGFDFDADAALSDADWVAKADFPSTRTMLGVHERPETGQRYRALALWGRWEQEAERDHAPRRDIWMLVCGYFVRRRELQRARKWLRSQDLWGRWMDEGRSMEDRFFLGEYPDGAVFSGHRAEDRHWHGERRPPVELRPASNRITLSFQADAFQKEALNVQLPSFELLAHSGATWDGLSGYRLPGEVHPQFFDPSIIEPGPSALLVHDDWLRSYLERRDLALIWTVLCQRSVLGMSTREHPGHHHRSQVLVLDGERVSASRPLDYSTPPHAGRR